MGRAFGAYYDHLTQPMAADTNSTEPCVVQVSCSLNNSVLSELRYGGQCIDCGTGILTPVCDTWGQGVVREAGQEGEQCACVMCVCIWRDVSWGRK